VVASIGSTINVVGSGARGAAAIWRSEWGSAWTACGSEIIVITEIKSPAAYRCGASRPGRRIRMRCRDMTATSSLITESVKTSHASHPTIVISPTRIVPSARVKSA
jgi:hypothetical protein